MQSITLLATLASMAFALPAPVPAGGPQCPGPGGCQYPIGTVLQIAVLQPSGEDYMASNYTQGPPAPPAAYIKTDSTDPAPPLKFVTTNATDSAGYTGVALQVEDFGLQVEQGGVVYVAHGATMKDFYLHSGGLYQESSPAGFYFCDANAPGVSLPGHGRIGLWDGNQADVPAGCVGGAAFVAIEV